MDADFRFPSIYVPSTCTHRARPAPAYPGHGPGRRRAGRFVQLRKEPLHSSKKFADSARDSPDDDPRGSLPTDPPRCLGV